MRSVIIVRHAKSNWDSLATDDFDRPLNERGKHDGPMMAGRLLAKGVSIDSFISSPAKRAKKTASLFAAEYKFDKEQIILVPDLYHAPPETFYHIIAKAPPLAQNIAVFGHNPGITEFVNLLTSVKIDDMPTCAVFAIKTDIHHWTDFANAPKEFWFFDYPKL